MAKTSTVKPRAHVLSESEPEEELLTEADSTDFDEVLTKSITANEDLKLNQKNNSNGRNLPNTALINIGSGL